MTNDMESHGLDAHGTDSHYTELLRVFKNSPADLDANRSGRLGPGQIRRIRRGAVNAMLAMLGAVAILILIIIFVATRPISGPRWALIAVVGLAGLAVGVYQSRRLRRALRDGTVECLVGPIRITLRGRTGWWLSVADRSFHLPVRFWHVGPGLPYRVYVAAAAELVVAMEPDPGVPASDRAQTVAAEPPLDPAMLHEWARIVCVTDTPDGASVLRALGFRGVLTEGLGDPWLEPPPAQAAKTRVDERQGRLAGLYFTPGTAPVTRAALDAEFGDGREPPRVHFDSPYSVAYRVAVEGAPYRCVIFASFHEPPTPEGTAFEILLRRDGDG